MTSTFEPVPAYQRPDSTEQPHDMSGSTQNTLGYSTSDAYDETPTTYRDPVQDLTPHPVFIVDGGETHNVDTRVSFGTFPLTTVTVQILGSLPRRRRIRLRNTHATAALYLTDKPGLAIPATSYKIPPGMDEELFTTEPLFAYTVDPVGEITVMQEHDAET